MKHLVRRATALVAVSLVAAAGSLVAPSLASAAVTLPAPEVIGGAYYDGQGAGYEVDWTAAASAHDSSVTLVGYEGVLYDGATLSHEVARSQTTATGDGLFVFSKLTIGVSYQATVRALYTVDSGSGPVADASAWKNADVSKALYPASAPTSASAKATSSGVITINWAATTTTPVNTEAIAAFLISVSPSFDFDDFDSPDLQFESISKTVSAGKRSTTVKGLKPGVTYDVSVYSAGSGGGFSFSDEGASATVKALGKPAAPTKLKVKTLKAKAAKLTWTGAKATAAGPVDGYRIYVNGTFKKKVGKSVRSYTAHGQKSGHSYKYTVKAYNKVGLSAAATISKKRP